MAVAFVLGCLTSLPVFAEEASSKAELAFDLEGITVEAARPDWESKLSPGSVTVIRPDDYKGEQKTLPDLLKKVPGVHVRDVNGKGQYTTVTVRGSTAAQVGVFIDGVLSNLGGDAAADLSTIPISNVERVEVYRGYIPARFGGTYMGGVINIVTKKPEKANVNVELGKSSYGGKKGAVEVTAPIGDGSLMFGTSYESSDGDFKYTNYAAKYDAQDQQGRILSNEDSIDVFHKDNIKQYENFGLYDNATSTQFQQDYNAWKEFLLDSGSDGFASAYINSDELKSKVENKTYQLGMDVLNKAGLSSMRDFYTAPDETKQKVYELDVQSKIADILPGNNPTTNQHEENISEAKKRLAYAKNPTRWRQYNDYENINSIIKWQNDNWMIKGSWNKIDRHLPNGLYNGGYASSATMAHIVDTPDSIQLYTLDSRRQKIDNKELLLQNRQTVGKLEWGWMLDYVRSEKEYKAENIYEDINVIPKLAGWSTYKSDKYSGQIDGTYKVSNNNMLDFLVSYSNEEMDVDGNKASKQMGGTYDSSNPTSWIDDPFRLFRNKYEQEILNVQLQDTITLDKKSSWQVTPSIRYNRSTIVGHSDKERFGSDKFKWITPRDEQSNSKTTWQLALKKEFDNNFTMRMTGGTYYRLLNMYEIAGDGTSIVPAPNSDGNYKNAKFPYPEEGKQFDISAIWNGMLLGADNNTTLTYFWRDSENMLQLQRAGLYYWTYFNDNKGTSKGVELQSIFSWNKFDLDIKATYTNSKMEKRNTSDLVQYDYVDSYPTYQPEWEGNVRLTYRPTDSLDFFTEAHYSDMYYTSHDKTEGASSGRPVDDLLVFNTGVKIKTRNNWQFTVGCNDVFNQGPKQKILIKTDKYGVIAVNPEYTKQGRTYYITAKYSF